MPKITFTNPAGPSKSKWGGTSIFKKANNWFCTPIPPAKIRRSYFISDTNWTFSGASSFWLAKAIDNILNWLDYQPSLKKSRSPYNKALANNIRVAYHLVNADPANWDPELAAFVGVPDISNPEQLPDFPTCIEAWFDSANDQCVFSWKDIYWDETYLAIGVYRCDEREIWPDWRYNIKGAEIAGEETYNMPGRNFKAGRTHVVALRACNQRGEISPWSDPVRLDIPDKPVSDFSGTPRKIIVPGNVSFTDLSENTVKSWLWNFGDGEYSTEQHPTHNYKILKSYFDVKLIAYGICESKNTKTRYKYIKTQIFSWIIRSSPADEGWTCVCWSPELSLFTALADSGTGNRVMTSPNGVTWTIRTSAADNDWKSVCWSPELSLFVAVAISGINNRVMTSPDGINWTIRTSPADNEWRSVCWSPELSLFVAVAPSGPGDLVMTSSDGINWTLRTPAAYNYWNSVCWSPELSLFVAVASSGVYNNVMTSPDGINWTLRSSAGYDYWLSVCWSPELNLFVAVAISGSKRVMTSPDGINWTIRTPPLTNNAWCSVCWSPELSLFAAVANSGSFDRSMVSFDGIDWILIPPAANNSWNGLCWSPKFNRFAAVASSGTDNRVMTSKS